MLQTFITPVNFNVSNETEFYLPTYSKLFVVNSLVNNRRTNVLWLFWISFVMNFEI